MEGEKGDTFTWGRSWSQREKTTQDPTQMEGNTEEVTEWEREDRYAGEVREENMDAIK